MLQHTHPIIQKRSQLVGSDLGSDAANNGEDTMRGLMSDIAHPASLPEILSHYRGDGKWYPDTVTV